MSYLNVEKLTKTFGNDDNLSVALDDVSFSVQKGECVAIIGKSGSGKTTLLNIIAGLDKPNSGNVILDEIDITNLSGRESALFRRQKIGVIYQFYNLIPELNVTDNIIIPAELDGREIDCMWLNKIIDAVGLSGKERSYPNMLSGGQQQRVAIARALFNRPSLILADEPIGNLDDETSIEVMSLFNMINKEYDTTLLIVTHSEKISRMADRVITMKNGKIISDRGR